MKKEKAIKRIEVLIDRLERGETVTLAQMKPAVGEDGIAKYKEYWQEELRTRKCRPYQLVEYAKRLNAVMLLERHDGKHSKTYSGRAVSRVVEEKCEKLWEFLGDIVAGDPSLQDYLDIPFQEPNEYNNICTLSYDELPRPHWWKRLPGRYGLCERWTKRECKINALISKLYDLTQDERREAILWAREQLESRLPFRSPLSKANKLKFDKCQFT